VILDTHELAWAAGFYDGEGCASVNNRKGGGKNSRLTVGQVHCEPLARFDKATGNIGVLNGPYPARNGHQPLYQWRTTGLNQCQAVMTMLWPWLCSIKRAQWDVVRQGVLSYKQEFAQQQSKKRLARKPGIHTVSDDQLEQILRILEPWRFKE
jgi:hypothetical protein